MALTKISTGGVKDDAASQAIIADEAVDEARLQISNAGSNGQFLQKTGNTGGLTWAAANEYTHPNHSGEVTSTADGAQVIADNIVDEANLKVDNTPTNDHVLTAKSSASGGLTWAAIPSSDPEVSIVASGSISTGQVVHLKSDGKVQVPTAIAQDVTDAVIDSNTNHYEPKGYYDSGQNKIFVAYRDSNNYGSGVVGTISGTSISFGTPVVFNSQATYYIQVGYSAKAGHGAVMYDKDNSNYNAAQAVKISGTTPSYNDIEEVNGWEAGASAGCISGSGSDDEGMAFIYKTGTVGGYIGVKRLIAGSYSSPSLTNGGDGNISNSGSWGATSIAYAPDPSFRHLVTWSTSGSSATGVYYRGIHVVGQIDATETSIHTIDSCRCTGTSIAFDTTNKKFLIVYKDHTNSKVKCLVVAQEMSGGSWQLTNSSTTDVFSSFTSTLGSRSLEFNPDIGKFVFHYPSSSGSKIRYATLNSSDNDVSWSAEENGRTNAVNDMVHVVYDTSSNQEIFGYLGSSTTSRWGIKTPASSTINTANYLGVSSGNYSDGDTAVIKLSGSTVASSSLTPGTQIYSSDAGALSATAGLTSVVVGKALSATSVLITE